METNSNPRNKCIRVKFQFAICPILQKKSGFVTMRQSKIRNIAAKLLTEIYSNVQVGPQLQPLSRE